MRIVAWNLGHQTRERAIRKDFIPAVTALRPDLLILNEYVHGESRSTLLDGLAALGLRNVLVSDRVENNNQVLVASRFEMSEGDLSGPAVPGGAGESNFLHVRVPEQNLEVVGIRVPWYKQKDSLREYWESLSALIRSTEGRRIVFAGDFNADPASDQHLGGSYLAGLDASNWQVPVAEGEWSFKSGSRIDHAIVAASVPVISAAYRADLDGKPICGHGPEMVSDHAALVVELDTDLTQVAPTAPAVAVQGNAASDPVGPSYANRGSQRWLQIAVNECPQVLNEPLLRILQLPDGATIEWLSPLRAENYVEYRDQPTLAKLGVTTPKRRLEDFWPASGPIWDGLARTSTGECLLIEAKAHVPELVSPGTRASEASKARIQASLREVQKDLSRVATLDWSGTFYQYTNRLAHLHFLRKQNEQPVHLVYIYFLNANDVFGPATADEFLGGIKVIESYLGLGRHSLSRYIHKIFVDVRAISRSRAIYPAMTSAAQAAPN